MNHKFLEPIKIGNVEVKNRMMYLAMAKYYDNLDGTVSEKQLEYVRSIAKGGTGLIVPGGMIVDPLWPSFIPMQPAIHDDMYLPGLKSLADAAHEYDAKILFQLWHGGECLYAGEQPPTVNDIDVDEIHRIQDCMVNAAERAIRAGADGVEVQICHNYIGSQFFSPIYNHRHDEYGVDTIENRLRFSLEYIKRIREAIGPDKILAVKLQADDYAEGGVVPADAVAAAPLIEAAGADMISVSGGGSLSNMFGMCGDGSVAEGWKVPNAAAVKAVVKIPVCATGSLRHPEFLDKILEEGKCDMIGMGRGLFAEREYVNKCMAGKEHTLRYCLNCLNCLPPNMNPDTSTCSVNPEAGREYSALPLVEDGAGRTVVVVGAGPAGMEAAATLKKRGFAPVVFDKGSEIGGTMHLAKLPPHKERFQWHINYMKTMAKELELDVRLNTEATVETIQALDPYAVLVASGSSVLTPPIPNLDKGTVYQSHDLLHDGIEVAGKKVVVIGGGQTGVETALYLAARDNQVTVVDFGPMGTMDLMDPAFQTETLIDYMRCAGLQIPLMYGHKVVNYDGAAVTAENMETGEAVVLPVDVLVLSTGVKPNQELYNKLVEAGVKNVVLMGDADKTGKIVNATQAGSMAAKALKGDSTMTEKYTVITGASTGIGHQAALKFAARGKNLIVAARNEEQLKELAEEIKGINPEVKVVIMPVDLSVEENVYKFYEATKAYFVETWINNAGIANLNSIYNQTTEACANIAKLNVVATTILSSLYVKDYKNVEGTTLLNTGSQTGYFMGELSVAYSASKFYVNAFTESLWYEMKLDPEAKLRVRLLAPFVTKSKFYERAYGVPGADEALGFGSTSEEMAGYMLELFDGEECLGDISPETFQLTLREPKFPFVMNPTT